MTTDEMKEREERRKNIIEKYKQQLEKNKELWNTIEISSIIGKKGDEWILLAMRIVLNEQQYSKDTCDILLNTPVICMIKEIKNIVSLDKLLDGLKNKSFKIADFNVKVQYFQFDWGRSRKTHNPFEIGTEWPIIWLRGHAKSVGDLIDERGADEKLTQLGYGTLYEESKELMDIQIGGSYMTRIHVIAPIYIKIDSGTLEREKMDVKVSAHKSAQLKDIIVKSPILRGEALKLNKVSDNNNFILYRGEKTDIPLDKEQIILRVYYKDDPEQIDIERVNRTPHEIANYNPRVATLFSLLEKDLFRKWLGIEGRITSPPKGKKQALEPYEMACVNLFSCAGFIVLNSGKGFDFKGVDLIAFIPEMKDVIMVSCVSSEKIGDKIVNIKPISNILKEELSDYNIYQVICTPAPLNDIVNKYKDSCKEEKVALIGADEMKEIYDMAIKGEYNEILSYIKYLIEEDYNLSTVM